LKSQIDGKGGVHQEYEKMIKGFQKNEEELQNEFTKAKHDNEKSLQKIKELTEKIRSLEN
jgi:peptidoglycan hydrolase CwlO-like protein